METSMGDLVFDLYVDEAPIASKNFLKLCKHKYYNNCEFFYVDRGFIIQTGDPTNTGNGGRSIYGLCYGPQADLFEDEISPHLKHSQPGTVSMANSGENRNGSQFFITTGRDLDSLDGKHTIFAEIAEGMETVRAIDNAPTNQNKQPYQVIRIRHTIILHDPFDDPPGLVVPPESPLPEIVDDPHRIAEDEVIDEDVDAEKLEELALQHRRKDAQSRAEVLEIIGDIKSADMKPPENVLFVARLNPVTTAEDLEIIFSRFGECKVDIIKDKVTGDSLCYGFIEYDDKAAAEKAYFKMDNTLIDDRRIKVDFSQSVSKLWNNVRRGKQEKLGKSDYDFSEQTAGMRASHRQPKSYGGRHMLFDTPSLHDRALDRDEREKRPRNENFRRPQKFDKDGRDYSRRRARDDPDEDPGYRHQRQEFHKVPDKKKNKYGDDYRDYHSSRNGDHRSSGTFRERDRAYHRSHRDEPQKYRDDVEDRRSSRAERTSSFARRRRSRSR
eukprot:CAMPEP_0198730334 /NCGR_PEP_ID=MMETSP1475-20131203/24075_1 /TAXON_ID= ORGANISM="Unidentified sp., Strain CCMP1999" /NCGR_SAMPLE_ID=MMETSP1475 /ASSEMBLY_ACC=CAM_ASM_001111 /LENGTH=496 /DNA_ID=CAMNT_0044493125 /DNA_START=1 /DNA_END=1491 /DNA_ORIENTATION=+